MEEYVLLTFYNRQTLKNPAWEVYGHKRPHVNDLLNSFKTKLQAIEYAHTFYQTPVIQGSNLGFLVKIIYNGLKGD